MNSHINTFSLQLRSFVNVFDIQDERTKSNFPKERTIQCYIHNRYTGESTCYLCHDSIDLCL